MLVKFILFLFLTPLFSDSFLFVEDKQMSYKKLNAQEEYVLIKKGTEAPFTGEYDDFYKNGIYHCKQCDAPLFDSNAKFKSGSGWPSFDEDKFGNVKRIIDKDGRRIEIVCKVCGAHLGHVFEGEGFTPKNTRHCVNSISLVFEEK